MGGKLCNGGRSAMIFQHHCRSSGGKVCNGGEGLQYNTGTKCLDNNKRSLQSACKHDPIVFNIFVLDLTF